MMKKENVTREKRTRKPAFFRILHSGRHLLEIIFKWGGSIAVLLFAFLMSVDFSTSYLVKDKIYTDLNKLPNYQNALLLGTAKYYAKGTPNLYYQYRIEAAVQLVKQNKINQLLVSGDNQTPYYNEPKMMIEDLLKQGVSEKIIQGDFAGYRTLDSVIRADKVYRLSPFIIISQQFHCERALFIAEMHHIEAVCFVAKYPDWHIKVRIRELFARAGMLWDYLMNNQPATFEKVTSKEIKVK